MRVLAAVLGLLALGASRSPAEDFFPLLEGVSWQYQEIFPTFVDSYTVFFQGHTTINGQQTVVRHFDGAGYGVARFRQYWSKDAEGDVYIHGWDSDPTVMRFDPPIRVLALPLSLGKTWSSITNSSLLGPLTLDFEVVAIGPVTVPAGTFSCTTIRASSSLSAAIFDVSTVLRGLPSAAKSSPDEFESYAGDVGEVLIDHGLPSRIDELLSYGPLVDVQPTTWTQIRQFYR